MSNAAPLRDRLLRIREVLELTGCGRAWLYRAIKRGDFPPPIRLGHRTAVWSEEAVLAWIDEKKRGATGRGSGQSGHEDGTTGGRL